jgi:hypothetical protein
MMTVAGSPFFAELPNAHSKAAMIISLFMAYL